MNDTLLFIPPCCVNKKLPKAIFEAPRRTLTFYTHGDVSMEKFYRAVSYLISDPHVMVIAIPTFTRATAAFLRQCFDRRWITDLVLTTQRDLTDLVTTMLAPHLQRVLYTCDDTITDVSSHIVLYNSQQALILTGPMFEVPGKYTLAAYNIQYLPRYERISKITTPSDFANPLRNVLLPDALLHRKDYIRKQKPQAPKDSNNSKSNNSKRVPSDNKWGNPGVTPSQPISDPSTPPPIRDKQSPHPHADLGTRLRCFLTLDFPPYPEEEPQQSQPDPHGILI